MKLDFCSACGAKLKKLTDTHYRCEQGHDFYNNARASVVLVLLNEQNELLYSKRAKDPQKGKFDLPGGFVDFGENAYDTLMREMQEELHITPVNPHLLTTVSNAYIENVTTVDCIYVCREWQGELSPSDDVADVEWRPLDFMRSEQFAFLQSYQPLHDELQAYLAKA